MNKQNEATWLKILEKKENQLSNMKTKQRKCTWCGKKATTQTARGEDNEKRGGLPQNDGWFCDKCWKKGYKMEEEAMFGGEY